MLTSVSVLAAAFVLIAAFIVSAYRWRWKWAGFTGAPPKLLWDWLDLLVVPLALAALAFTLNLAQSNRDQRREDDRARTAALAAYVQQVSNLLLESNLLSPQQNHFVRELTLTVLPRLGGAEKGVIAKLLAESNLIQDFVNPRLDLADADLSGAVIHGRYDHNVFTGVDLRDGDLRRASLVGADFEHADLRGAVFDKADLDAASFAGADLRGASFKDAILSYVQFTGACLDGVRFTGARLSNANFKSAGGHEIDFSDSLLSAVDLEQATFSTEDVTLTGADLISANEPLTPEEVADLQDPCAELR